MDGAWPLPVMAFQVPRPARRRVPVRIEVPLPFPIGTANAWLFPGAQPALVDCGIGTDEGWRAVAAALARHGVAPAGLRLFVTHGHVDHAGNAHRLVAQGAVLHAPREERPMLEAFRRDADRRNAEFAQALAAHGAPAEVVEALRRDGRAVDLHTQDVPVGQEAHEGQAVVLGDEPARVHLTPGHTAGSLVLLSDRNELLSGDTLLQHITSNAIELRDADRGRYAQYLRTLDRLRRFAGCDVLPGHHEPFRLDDALLDDHLERHHRRSRRVLQALDRPRTAWELLPRVLPHLAEGQAFLGMCEVVGHLHRLVDQGLATQEEAAGLRRFRRV
jgi:glyoxylase-like metal-dependent hydrolase (beta-lactamase superfamily II)